MILPHFSVHVLSQCCACNLLVLFVLALGFDSQAGAQAPLSCSKVEGVKSADRFDVQRLDAINELMDQAVEEGALVGASVLILQDGQEAFFNTWGYHDREKKSR